MNTHLESISQTSSDTGSTGFPGFFLVDPLIRGALAEDIGSGDITTRAVVSRRTQAVATLLAKESGVLCGLPVFCRVFQILDPAVQIECRLSDGSTVSRGETIARITGPAASILSGERVALNFLQRLSGIASKTRIAVQQVAGNKARITDTRKTVPGLRILEKYAVRVGGGVNHRFNLADGILIKDNHIQAAGGIGEAVRLARANAPHTLRIEVETENLGQVEEALAAGADVIMLDNMDEAGIRDAVCRVAGRALVEISGNMGERDLASLAACGVDLISIGALTHSAKALDISLRFEPLPGSPH